MTRTVVAPVQCSVSLGSILLGDRAPACFIQKQVNGESELVDLKSPTDDKSYGMKGRTNGGRDISDVGNDTIGERDGGGLFDARHRNRRRRIARLPEGRADCQAVVNPVGWW